MPAPEPELGKVTTPSKGYAQATAPVRAKDVTVVKHFRAECHRCTWLGANHLTYANANAERMAHLADHVDNHEAATTDG